MSEQDSVTEFRLAGHTVADRPQTLRPMHNVPGRDRTLRAFDLNVRQQRAPLNVAFDKNTFRTVFRKEVKVLKVYEA